MHVPLIPERPTLRPPKDGPLLGKQLLLLLPDTGCDVRGVEQLWRTLRPVGVRVAAATETQGEIVGDEGKRLTPDLLTIEVHVDEWDALIVAGGTGAETMAEDPLTRELLRAARAAGRFVGAFGSGADVLARAGVEGVVRATAEELAPAIVSALVRIRAVMVQPSP